MPSVPTKGEVMAKLIEDLAHAQEHAATYGHLISAEGSKEDIVLGNAWITVSELIKGTRLKCIQLATKGLQ